VNKERYVYSVYSDGLHITCFDTEADAQYFCDSSSVNKNHVSFEKEEYEPLCDCRNLNLNEEIQT